MNELFDGFALLIGVNENQVPSMALPAVANDVHAITEVLTHPNRCAYPGENVKVLVDANATRNGILDGLAWLQEKVLAHTNDDITVFIFYSGHGWRDDTSMVPVYYLIPYDFDPQHARLTALPAQDFAIEVANLHPLRLIVVLDCCHAGGIGLKSFESEIGFSPSAIPSALFISDQMDVVGKKDVTDTLKTGHGRAVLSSSQGNQSSYLCADQKMSVFTYHLIEGLTGHAEPKEGAREVLVSDLISHVARRVPESVARMGRLQQPEFRLNGNSFPVALLLGGIGFGKDVKPPDPLEHIDIPTINYSNGRTTPTLRDKARIGNYFQGNQTLSSNNDRSVQINAPMTGGQIITGDKNRVTIQPNSDEVPSIEKFLELLHEMQVLILTEANCGALSSEEAAQAIADMTQVIRQAHSREPNGNAILMYIDKSVNFFANLTTVVVSAPQLIDLGKKLADWARVLFRT